MKPKFASIFLVTLLLLLSVRLSQGGRHFPTDFSVNRHVERNEEVDFDGLDQEVCDKSEEECMMRRTLVAHTDYIYTQGNNN
ncbi:phytosulfokines-like protein [Carex littledalei]|uniref:Phytosulfokine n=1 Tax=Carex littledalei TaxID=544730 RepID=A0A833QBI9_9POAL|nr:phytosulfokines-like protein [Carex littledalei]